MTKDDLILSARDLVQPEPEIAGEYAARKDAMASRVVESLGQRADLDKLIGPDNSSMMMDNAHNMARFMESMFERYDPPTFVETILWVFRAYRSHGFRLTFWSAHLNTWIETLQAELSPEASAALRPYYDWIQTRIPVFTALTDPAGPDSG